MVVQGSGCALQDGTWVPLWEKGCCLLSVQVAEKQEWCVWQWCVCVCWRIYSEMHGLGGHNQRVPAVEL